MREPVEDIVRILRQALKAAKQGKTRSVLVIGLLEDGAGIGYFVEDEHAAVMIGLHMSMVSDKLVADVKGQRKRGDNVVDFKAP